MNNNYILLFGGLTNGGYQGAVNLITAVRVEYKYDFDGSIDVHVSVQDILQPFTPFFSPCLEPGQSFPSARGYHTAVTVPITGQDYFNCLGRHRKLFRI